MKQKITVICLLLAMLMQVLLLAGCQGDTTTETTSGTSSDRSEPAGDPDPRAAAVWNDQYADEANGLTAADSIYTLSAFDGGKATDSEPLPASGTDVRYLFAGKEATRAVVPAEGYCLTLPGKPTADFSLGKFRSQYKTEDYCLTATRESQNPYGNNKDGYDMYISGWLVEQIDDVQFLTENSIMRTRAVEKEVIVGDFEVTTYCMKINVGTKIEFPFYQIAILRPNDTYDYFYLLVLKSKEKQTEMIDGIIASFAEIDRVGTPQNGIVSYECKPNPNWSEETRAYYDQINARTDVGFGAFHQDNDIEYTDWLWGEEALNVTPDVYMTYLHIGWDGVLNDFSEAFGLAQKYAGGNGFDDKPVFHLTYQFTVTNNATGGVYTPMFDILRDKLDDYFRELAAELKKYGKPVIFRLNNEMNSDWTDYCGMMTLIDPDIFQETWRHLYRIFEEEGVDNCIWVFNPIAVTCPYCNWGETLCYMPGEDYVQMLGLTYYQMNNGTDGSAPASFREMYQEHADKMLPYFSNFPWIIGEFACGSGGNIYYDWDTGKNVMTELDRNAKQQAQWVKEMIDCFEHNQDPGYEFCKRIKLAIWFSADDIDALDGEIITYNRLRLDKVNAEAIAYLAEYLQKG